MRRFVIVLLVLAAGTSPAIIARSAAAFSTVCQGEPATIVATGQGDVVGTGGRDVIAAADVAERTIHGLGGNDLICASNNDTVYAGSGDDVVQIFFFDPGVLPGAVYGESGNDFVRTALVDIVSGGSGNDYVTSQFGTTLSGGGGQDVLDAVGVGTCDGGSGNDAFDTNDDCAVVHSVP
jgi:hypothetical protein